MKEWNVNSYRNLWQHPIWGEFQKSIGQSVWFLKADGASALVIKHKLPFNLNWLEVPRGPLFENEEDLAAILDELKELGKKEKSVFVRMSPFAPLKANKRLFAFRGAAHDHHPETSLLIDLEQDEEEILKQMKPKGRYNIKVARKHEVTVEPSKEVDEFYEILKKTGNRDGFGIHSKSYYQKMLDAMPKNAQLLLAVHESNVIAGGIFVYLDKWAVYYYGASDSKYRNVMAPYLVQWEAIKEAKERGCKYYDFLGIAPEHAEQHPWKGVTNFKKKFGGQVINYPKAKDMVMRPLWYWIYRIYKKVR